VPESPDKRFSTGLVKLIGLVSVIGATIIAGFQIYDRCCASKPPEISVQYVLDVSSGMGGKLKGVAKLAAARTAILRAVRRTPDVAYGLRFAQPGCSSDYKPPAVRFGEHNADDFDRRLGSVSAGGASNFAQSVEFAVNDLTRQQGTGGSKRGFLILVVGGPDRCTPRPAKAIGDALDLLQRDKTAKVTFRFIGVNPPEGFRAFLRRVGVQARQAGFNAKVEFPKDQPDLLAAIAPPKPTPTPPSP
jgi:hypothetical protein